MQYCDIFGEVRQRVAAFKNWLELYGDKTFYGKLDEDEYLEHAYRFLFCAAFKEFIEFCAKKEGLTLDEYCLSEHINKEELY